MGHVAGTQLRGSKSSGLEASGDKCVEHICASTRRRSLREARQGYREREADSKTKGETFPGLHTQALIG